MRYPVFYFEKQFLSKRNPNGHWRDRFYQPKWTSTYYTLLELRNLNPSPNQKLAFYSFFECFETIAQRPFAFESVDYIKKGYQRCVNGVDSISYRINDETVEIMAIIGRQDLNDIL